MERASDEPLYIAESLEHVQLAAAEKRAIPSEIYHKTFKREEKDWQHKFAPLDLREGSSLSGMATMMSFPCTVRVFMNSWKGIPSETSAVH
jgi:hypothetical protein